MKFLLLLLVAAVNYVAADKVSYKDYQVFRMSVKTDDQVKFVRNLVESCNGCSFWNGLGTIIVTSVMVDPRYVIEFTDGMNKSNIKYEKFIDDVQELVDYQVTSGGNEKGFGWTRYHTLEEIYDWFNKLAEKYPNNVEIIIGGSTYEGRDIKGVKISSKKNNPGVFIECGIHPPEWIATAMGTYLINELLTNKDSSVRKLAESYDWYIFPSLNPDGHIYSHETDRLWIKSRSRNDSGCDGANLNRNWDYMWMGAGAYNNSCDPKFAGSTAFSEVETRTMSKYIASLKDKLFAYITFHSFGQLLMVPYGYTSEHLDNYNETMTIAAKAVESLSKRYGTKYKIGTFFETMYPAAGTSLDWVKAVLKLPLVYTYELRDKGDYGMLLPPAQIIPNCQEVLDSLVTMFEEAEKLGYPRKYRKRATYT